MQSIDDQMMIVIQANKIFYHILYIMPTSNKLKSVSAYAHAMKWNILSHLIKYNYYIPCQYNIVTVLMPYNHTIAVRKFNPLKQ